MSPPRPHPFARSAFAQKASDLIAMSWERGWQEKSPIDPDYLWQQGSKGFSRADETAFRSEEDVADFRLRLELLCESLHAEAALNPFGHFMAFGQIQNAIRTRHALGGLWRKRPALAETPIAPPIIVVGQMRSGTTRVQRLLASDPALCGTRFCDSYDPVPQRPDWRPLKARAILFVARRTNPWLDTQHPFGATRTDEEIGWLSSALSPAAFEAQWHIPSFVAFSEQGGSGPVYREFEKILRTDAAHRHNADRPRVLKCPQFAEDLPDLLERFPDARIVHCQRDEAQVLASSLSMVASQVAYQSDRHDLRALEREWTRKIALRRARTERALAAFTGPLAQVSFDDLNADWREAMAAAYRELGISFTPATQAAMQREVERSRGGAHTRHKAQLRAFAD